MGVGVEQLQVWDVVEYRADADLEQQQQQQQQQPYLRRLGLVQEVTADGVQVSPLVEEDEAVWVLEEDEEDGERRQWVQATSVLRVVDSAYGQRQDREHNPHGEHCHDAWQVLSPLGQDVFRGGGGGGR